MHVHILPRKFTDFGGENDEVYPLLETAEAELNGEHAKRGKGAFKVDADEDRPPRTREEMEREAKWLEGLCREADESEEREKKGDGEGLSGRE